MNAAPSAPPEAPPPPAEAGGWRGRNPWWIPIWLGRVPEIEPTHLRLLGAVGLATLFENYDQAMLTQAVKQIAADFGLIESDLGNLLGSVRLGAVPAFFLIPFADRIGRRRLFLLSVIGMSVGTVLSALSQSPAQFVALQMLVKIFVVTSSATAFVIVTEEFPAQHRGWGIGILGALGAFGVGLSALLFAAIDFLPYGWRAMYLLGFAPIALLPYLRRRVRETRRFEEHDRSVNAEGSARRDGGWLGSLGLLWREHRARFVAIGVIGSLSSGGHAAAYNFSAYYVQTVHGWAPGQYTLLLLAAGTVGIIGFPYAGRLADLYGRRAVGFGFFAVFPLLSTAFYTVPGTALFFVWIPLVFSLTGGLTIARALATELFPTASRGSGSGWLMLVETLGAAGCLFAVSLFTPEGGSSVPAVIGVSFATLGAGLCVLLLPETSRRELEEIHAARAPSG